MTQTWASLALGSAPPSLVDDLRGGRGLGQTKRLALSVLQPVDPGVCRGELALEVMQALPLLQLLLPLPLEIRLLPLRPAASHLQPPPSRAKVGAGVT